MPFGKLAQGIYQGVTGLSQRKKAKGINPQRPTYKIPRAQKTKKSLYQNRASSTRLPGESYRQDEIAEQTSAGVSNIQEAGGSVSDVIAGVSGVAQSGVDAEESLAQEGARMRQENEAMYAQALTEYGQYQDKAWDYNVQKPYQIKRLRKQRLKGASRRNIMGGIGNVGGAMTDFTNLGLQAAGMLMGKAPKGIESTGGNTSVSTPKSSGNATGQNYGVGFSSMRVDPRMRQKARRTG